MITYISTMILCFWLTAVLFLCNYKNWRSRVWRPIFFIYILLMASELADACWWAVNGNPDHIFWNYFFNSIEFASLAWIGFCWFCYCTNYDDSIFHRKRYAKILAAIPVVLATVLIITAPHTRLAFYVDEDGFYQRGSYYIVQMISYIYLTCATIITILNWKKSSMISRKKHLLTMIIFIITPALMGIMQIIFPPGAVPSLQFSIAISLLLQHADDLDRKVTHDSLTKLINRYEFERILYDRMLQVQKNNSEPLYLLMGDIDKFKMVNDTMGHQAGDQVLIQVARILTDECIAFHAIPSRISGDEFCVIMNTDSPLKVNSLISKCDETFRRLEKINGYPVSVSFGYAVYDGISQLNEFLHQADEEMYRAKNKRKHCA